MRTVILALSLVLMLPVAGAAAEQEWAVFSGRDTLECNLGVCTGVSEVDDPRLGGDVRLTYRSRSDGEHFVLWGDYEVTGEEGSWSGEWVGQVRPDGQHVLTSWLAGQGAYEGLSVIANATGDGYINDVEGLVYSGPLPPAVAP